MRRLALVASAAVAVLFAGTLPAWAHVTVSAQNPQRGANDVLITFRVPVEEDTATTGLTVSLPTSTPIAGVDVLGMAGWKHTQKMTTLSTPIDTDDGQITEVVSEIEWTATAGGLQPGEFGEFTILAGLLPNADSITFPAIQTYANGSTVSWTEVAAPGSSAEPDHPAPVLELTGAAPSSSSSGAPDSITFSATAAAGTSSGKASNTGPIALAIIALVVAAGALGLSVVNRVRGTRSR